MKNKETYRRPGYFKIMLVCMKPDGCWVLKGPREEQRLAEVLRDDYHVSRYEKMLQLVVREMVEETAQEKVLQLFSTRHLQEEFNRGGTDVSCFYQRKIDGEMRKVRAAAFPRKFDNRGQLKEFMIYVSEVEEKTRIEGCVWENEDAKAGEN